MAIISANEIRTFFLFTPYPPSKPLLFGNILKTFGLVQINEQCAKVS